MAFLILLICVVCVILFILLMHWLVCQPDNAIYIKFNSFVSFYNINPDRWSLNDDSVDFVRERHFCYSNYIYYKFYLIDFYRYKHWHKKLIKQEKLQKEINNMNEMIRIVKSDLTKFEAENQCQIERATNNIKEIISRM